MLKIFHKLFRKNSIAMLDKHLHTVGYNPEMNIPWVIIEGMNYELN